MDAPVPRRHQQRLRTRKDLLRAAARLMREGRRPSLEDIAREAMVSRATAYRHFPHLDALLAEAALDLVTPEADALFDGRREADALARVLLVDKALHEMVVANEGPLRQMLASSVQHGMRSADAGVPARQNRRTPLIEAALAPHEKEFDRATLALLRQALALIVGTEAMIVFKDVLRVSDAQARKVKRWAIAALIEAARRPEARGPGPS